MPIILAPAPKVSTGHAPFRRAGSVRRTSTIDASWPLDGKESLILDARARDLLTPANEDRARVLVWDQIQARLSADRSVEEITCQPLRPGLQQLVGARAGRQLRQALNDALREERVAGSPFYLLIDDFAGMSVIAPWGRQQWHEGTNDLAAASPASGRVVQAERPGPMEGVCIGFRPGSSSLHRDPPTLPNCAEVLPLTNPEDSVGWHELPLFGGMSMRRSRRIDIWREGDEICVESMFQDSASKPDGKRKAVHEYSLEVRADALSLKVTRVLATPRILPFPECPSAVENLNRLIGVPLPELRTVVLERLSKTLGCTHLNDALRALAEVPMLFDALNAA